jgi:large subunit ribosomal protein L30
MKLQIKLTRSAIGRSRSQQETVRALGLRRLNQTVIHESTPQVRGMVNTVSHLLVVEELNGGSD